MWVFPRRKRSKRLTHSITLRDIPALVTGGSRKEIAAALGCSERHLRRRIRALLARLEVSTTHAAGALAASAGILLTAAVTFDSVQLSKNATRRPMPWRNTNPRQTHRVERGRLPE